MRSISKGVLARSIAVVLLMVWVIIYFKKRDYQVNLATLKLDERVSELIKYDERNLAGINTVEVPFAAIVECRKSTAFTFNNIKLEQVNVVFQIHSDVTKTDTSLHDGMGHLQVSSFKTKDELNQRLKALNADSVIYGYRIELNSPELTSQLLGELTRLYGKGTKNPNTDNGLYWNLAKENKFIFFAPDYDRLIVLNNSRLSKTCYWDNINGLIDFGGCNKEKYLEDLSNRKF